MTEPDPDAADPTPGAARYACPTCGGGIGRSCRCARAAGDWLYAEEVIVTSAGERSRRA